VAVIFSFRKGKAMQSVIGQLDQSSQQLQIAEPVLKHVARHRQLTPWSSEAGGQLFGLIDAEKICIVEVAGPYAGDERSRYRYRSNPVAAQRAIDERSNRGLLYLGEWHTHAEDYPNASGLDDKAMASLITSSSLNSSGLLMMIVGRSLCVKGLGVWSVSSTTAYRWELTQNKYKG
jgi:integrative and conjugative element protein (TIGR02256 family)